MLVGNSSLHVLINFIIINGLIAAGTLGKCLLRIFPATEWSRSALTWRMMKHSSRVWGAAEGPKHKDSQILYFYWAAMKVEIGADDKMAPLN